MPEELPDKMKTHLALAVAQGRSVRRWALANGVPTRTAYRWAAEPLVRAAVNSTRQRALDRAVNRMAQRATWAAEQIAKLAENAESESVRLRALKSILSDMVTVSKYTGLEVRMSDIEEKLRERARAAALQG
jgi:hypothetical protein